MSVLQRNYFKGWVGMDQRSGKGWDLKNWGKVSHQQQGVRGKLLNCNWQSRCTRCSQVYRNSVSMSQPLQFSKMYSFHICCYLRLKSLSTKWSMHLWEGKTQAALPLSLSTCCLEARSGTALRPALRPVLFCTNTPTNIHSKSSESQLSLPKHS